MFHSLRSSFYKRNPNLSTFSSFIKKRSGADNGNLPESFSGFYGKRAEDDIPSSFSSFYGKICKFARSYVVMSKKAKARLHELAPVAGDIQDARSRYLANSFYDMS